MEANNRMLYDDIIKKTDVQYTIPVYQRNYTWEKENCELLYNDIVSSIKNERNHFLGSLVYSTTKRNDIKSCPIIDGQQRLTTIMLLLKAIDDLIKDPENITKKKIRQNIYNENCEERYKLKLKNSDNDNSELEKVLMGNTTNLDTSSKVVINYNHFKSLIKKTVESEKWSPDKLVEGIDRLEIVEIVLNEGDSPQKIFESINSTGVKLTTADLIRNFLLMGILDVGKQAEIYKNYWITIESLIGKDNIEKFFYDFLVSKDTRYIEEKRVYENFKKYYINRNIVGIEGIENIFTEIVRYAQYYKLLVLNDSKDYDEETNNLCNIFNILQHRTIYPFMLKVCNDFDDIRKLHIINKNDEGQNVKVELSKEENNLLIEREKEFNNIIRLFGNYAMRRNIANIPSSSLRRFYASLYNKIFEKNRNNYNCYFKACEAYLCTLKTEDRMPNDNMFKEGLLYSNMYAAAKTKILRYFFDLIENSGKEPVDMSELTIEHIMPETLSSQWKNSLGDNFQEIYDKYVHTLGNLSITGYNSEYSNDQFLSKKKRYNNMLESGETKIVKLNEELKNNVNKECNIEVWNDVQIEKRAERLSKIIMSKFSYPNDVDTTLEFEKFFEFYIDNPDDNADEFENNPTYKLYGFQFEGNKYRADNYRTIFKEIIKLLYNLDNSVLDDLANSNYTYERGKTIRFSRTKENDYQEEILPSLFVYTNYSRSTIFDWIRNLFNRYQLDITLFSLLFIEKD